MQILSSMFSLVKNVKDTDRQFKMLKQKLAFGIKKGEAALAKFKRQQHSFNFMRQNLESNLKYAYQKLSYIENLLQSSTTSGISIKQKFKLSLPFNNEKDKITRVIDELRQATQDLLNNNLSQEPKVNKKKIQQSFVDQDHSDIDPDDLDLMGPTIQENNALDFAQQIMKNHTLELTVQICGDEKILNTIDKTNKLVIKIQTRQRACKQQFINLYVLGRMNFKNEYKVLKAVYPDIDKISKNCHFTVKWKRNIALSENKFPKKEHAINETSQKREESSEKEKKQLNGPVSQKKQQADLFFSVPQVCLSQFDNGAILLQREEGRSLYKQRSNEWKKIDELSFQLINGQKLAISLNKQQVPDIFFKLNYKWK